MKWLGFLLERFRLVNSPLTMYQCAGVRRYGRPLVINFILGLFVGAVVGLLIAALMRAND